MEQGNGRSATGAPTHVPLTFRKAWSRELSPVKQSVALTKELDQFAIRLTRLAWAALVAGVILAGILVSAAVVATAVEILRWSDVLPSHGNQFTLPHLLPAGFLITPTSGGGLWLRSWRKRNSSPPEAGSADSTQHPTVPPPQDYGPSCPSQGDDHADGHPQAGASAATSALPRGCTRHPARNRP
jgi:hypothetical protein